jgi:predicted AAA+ superfamily ATPase
MEYISREIEPLLKSSLDRGKSVLLLGARQTGKTTLLRSLSADLSISFIQPRIRQRYEQDPSLLTGEIEALAEGKSPIPLIIIDEVQKIPEILNVVQDLIDRQVAQFILTGSSARKLRVGATINLLPGRVVVLRLDPLSLSEIHSSRLCIEDLLMYGSLPGIFTVPKSEDKDIDLSSYVTTYLEEEIRSEAVVRKISSFSRFLSLAAAESGATVNFRKLSQELGIAHTTISAYYQILEDCLIAERIDPLLHTKTRRKLIKSSKYLFFDLGVRRAAAGEGLKLPESYMGQLFEQWVGLELIRNIRLKARASQLNFWRDVEGHEVDWIITKDHTFIPIEVKWTENPKIHDIKGLKLFQREYDPVPVAYLVCRVPRKIKLTEGIYALPWQEVDSI